MSFPYDKKLFQEKLQKKGLQTVSNVIQPIDNSTLVALSYPQEQLWFLDQVTQLSQYQVCQAVVLRGLLHTNILTQALQQLTQRQQILRSFIGQSDGMPVLQVAEHIEARIEIHDISAMEKTQQQKTIACFLSNTYCQPWDLKAPPLWKLELFCCGPEQHIAVFITHHIMADAWSLAIFVQELGELYQSLLTKQPAHLPELAIQYRDFAHWQRTYLVGERLARHEEYWQTLLRGQTTSWIPWDQKTCQQSQTTSSAPIECLDSHGNNAMNPTSHIAITLEQKLTTQLQELARQNQTTLFTTLLALLHTCIYRYAGPNNLVIGSPFANRHRPEFQHLMGMFVNTLPLCNPIQPHITFVEYLRQVRDRTLEALDHQEIPLEKLVQAINPERKFGQNPLFNVVMVLQNIPALRWPTQELKLETYPLENPVAKFDVTLTWQEQEQKLIGDLEYRQGFAPSEWMQQLARHFVHLAQSVVANPQEKLCSLPIMAVEESNQILARGQAKQYFPVTQCLHQRFSDIAQQCPNQIAVVGWEEQAQTQAMSVVSQTMATRFQLTYQELDRLTNQMARCLQQRGVGPEVLVGVFMERDQWIIPAILAILKAGGAYVPIDTHYPADRIAFIIQDTRMSLILTELHLVPQLTASVPIICLDQDQHNWQHLPTDTMESHATPQNLAYIIYTSGSTGKPKGVLIPHAQVMRLMASTAPLFTFSSRDVWTLFHSVAFDFSVWEIWGALLYGGRLVVVPYTISRDTSQFYDLLIQEKVTVLNQTPSAFRQLSQYAIRVHQNAPDSPACQHLPCHGTIIFGGEALEISALADWMKQWGTGTTLVNMYGITETTVHVTHRIITPQDIASPSLIGNPLPDMELYLLDQELQPVPIGVVGEIYVGGEGLGRGYWNRPELTSERFIAHPFSHKPGARLYKSGDLGRYLPSGELEYLGRADHQVKIRGFRIELAEIQAAIALYPEVQESVVVQQQDARTGDKRLVAYLVPRPSSLIHLSALRHILAQKIPDYMIPSHFVVVDKIPLTPHGKCDYRALAQMQAEQEAAATQRQAASKDVETWDTVERTIADAWTKVLGQPPASREQNFFEAGGHSLLATQFLLELRQALGQDVLLRMLFESPTIAGLAKAIQARKPSAALAQPSSARSLETAVSQNNTSQVASSAEPPALLPSPAPLVSSTPPSETASSPAAISPATSASSLLSLTPPSKTVSPLDWPISLGQERLWFLQQIDPTSAAYNMPGILAIRGQVMPNMLELAFQILASRHLVLTSVCPEQDGKPYIRLLPTKNITLQQKDLRSLPEEQRLEQAQAIIQRETSLPFDLSKGPLLRLCWIQKTDTESLLVVTLHHLICDGWSLEILLREVSQIYQHLSSAHTNIHLPALPIQYGDFAQKQRQSLTSTALQPQLDYWKKQLEGELPLSPFPLDCQRKSTATFQGHRETLSLSPIVSQQLQRLSQQHHTTLFMNILAGWAILGHRISQANDMIFGVPISGRQWPEIKHLIGFFVNTLPIRIHVASEDSVSSFIHKVHQVCLDAYSNSDIPFEQLVAALQPHRNLATTPIFQVMVNDLQFPDQPLSIPGLELQMLPLLEQWSKFDLTLYIHHRTDHIALDIVYNRDLFRPATIQTWLQQLAVILAHIAMQQDTAIPAIGDLPMMSQPQAQEQKQAFQQDLPTHLDALEFHPNPKVKLPGSHVLEWLQSAWKSYARQTAVEYGDWHITYQELQEETARLTRCLQSIPIKNSVVAVLAKDRRYLVYALIACLQAGKIFMPLDPDFPPKRLSFILHQVQPDAIVGEREPIHQEAWQTFSSAPLELNESLVQAVPAYLYFTSGSTGYPKGVLGQSLGLSHFLRWEIEGLDMSLGMRIAQLTMPSVDVALRDILAPLCTGGTIVIPTDSHIVWDIEKLAQWLEYHRIHVLHCVPSLWSALLHDGQGHRFPDMQYCLMAGEIISAADVALWYQRIGQHVQLVNLYGATETNLVKCAHIITPQDVARGYIPAGKPMPGVTMAVVKDVASKTLAAPGEPGEIFFRTPYLSLGYYENMTDADVREEQKKANRVFYHRIQRGSPFAIPHGRADEPDHTEIASDHTANSSNHTNVTYHNSTALAHGCPMYQTGDLGRWNSDGTLQFLGRKDRQIKIRGLRIEPLEIEQTLCKFPGVHQAIVIPHAQDTNRLVAYMTGSPDLDIAEIRTFLRRYLPEYFIPAHFMLMRQFPKLPGGKIALHELTMPCLEAETSPTVATEGHSAVGSPNQIATSSPTAAGSTYSTGSLTAADSQAAATSSTVPPTANPYQEIITTIMGQVLRQSYMSSKTSFFDLGGHSLLMTQVLSRIRQAVGVEISLQQFLENPTVAGICHALEQQRQEAQSLPELTHNLHDPEGAPLSFAQERLWFLHQLQPGNPAYNMSRCLKLTGPVSPYALQVSLDYLIARHPILRTVIVLTPHGPRQKVLEPGPCPFKMMLAVMKQHERTDKDQYAMELLQQEASQPFDISQDILFRAVLIPHDFTHYWLLLQSHHIAVDGSMDILLKDLATFYQAALELQHKEQPHFQQPTTQETLPCPQELPALSVKLPKLDFDYRDFALWQRQCLTGQQLSALLTFWKQTLQDAPHTLSLPLDYRRPAIYRFVGKRYSFHIWPATAQALLTMSKQQHTTLFVTMLSTFAVLLKIYTGQRDFLVGTPVSQRDHHSLDAMVGCFVNTLVLRCNCENNPTWLELLARIHQTFFAAFQHRQMPYEMLIEALQVVREPSHPPLIQAMLVVLPELSDVPAFSNLQTESVVVDPGTARLDLLVSLRQAKQGMIGAVEYNSDIFSTSTIEHFIQQWLDLLEILVAHPSLHIEDLPSSPSWLQQLELWNQTAGPYPNLAIHQLFEQRAAMQPDHPALKFDYVGQEGTLYDKDTTIKSEVWTYQQLNRQANTLAAQLMRSGIGRGSQVAVYMERSPYMIQAVLAILKTGAAYVPMEIFYPKDRMAWIIQNLGISTAITLRDQAGMLRTLQQDGCPLTRIVILDEKDQPKADEMPIGSETISDEASPISVMPSDMAYTIFTSGSTGTPKGVMVQHGQVVNVLDWINQYNHISHQDTLLFVTSLCFDLSVYDIFGTLAAGGCIYIANRAQLQEPQQLASLLLNQPITIWDSAPAALGQLLPILEHIHPSHEPNKEPTVVIQPPPSSGATLTIRPTEDSARSLPSLRLVMLSGDWIPVTMPAAIQKHFPQAQVLSLGGATEAVIWSNYYPVQQIPANAMSIPYGQPMRNARYYILDEFLHPCPLDVPGDLYIGGDCLALGYAAAPALTAEKFLPDPYATKPGSRMYATGDRARYHSNGNMEFLGRKDHQIKIRGFRIELGEIESVLAQHPAIQQSLVTAKERQGQKYLVGYVIPKENISPVSPPQSNIALSEPSLNASLPESQLKAFLQQKLPEYMIPETWVFLHEFPLNSNGKIDRRRLPEPEFHAATSTVPPRTPLESQLHQIWQQVLGIHDFGIQDNFFSLGGNSLMVTQVLVAIQQQWHISITLRILLEHTTIEGLASWLAQKLEANAQLPSFSPAPSLLDKLSDDEVDAMLRKLENENE